MGLSFLLLMIASLLTISTADIWSHDQLYLDPLCDYKYDSRTNLWYKVHHWWELNNSIPESICRNEGGKIAEILENGEMDTVLLELMEENNLPFIRMDASGNRSANSAIWAYKLLLFNPDANFLINSDLSKTPFICTRNLNTTNKFCATSDTGYEYDPRSGSCYKFHKEFTTWCEAMNTCVSEGGRLAIINSEEEARIIKAVFAKNPSSSIPSPPGMHPSYRDVASIGFLSTNKGKTWKTTEGTRLTRVGYNKWQKGEPNNFSGNEYCGVVLRNGEYQDDPCNSRDKIKPFICEKSPFRSCSTLKVKEKAIVDKRCARRNAPTSVNQERPSDLSNVEDSSSPPVYDYVYDDYEDYDL